MKNMVIGAVMGMAFGSAVTGMITGKLLNEANKKLAIEKEINEKLVSELHNVREELNEFRGRFESLEKAVKENDLLNYMNKEKSEELKQLEKELTSDKDKMAEARREIANGVEALKNAMFCQSMSMREELVAKNYTKVISIITKIEKEVEFERRFENHGRDFKWLEGNVEVINRKMSESTADLEALMQLLGYEEKEKQILRWYFKG